MDADDLELFRRTIEHALSTGGDLADAGWHDALAADRRTAVAVLFETQGRLCAVSDALVALGVTVVPNEAGGLDPDLGWAAASAPDPEVERVARLALSYELVGASRAMLDLACDHARERIQFGQPIARFQAVRHRLAESLVAVEAAAGAVDAAWDDGSTLTAACAKAIAGRNARLVAKHCQQVCAGIGFTLEHPLHRYLRRVLTLDRLLGDHRTLTRELGEELLRARTLPALLPL